MSIKAKFRVFKAELHHGDSPTSIQYFIAAEFPVLPEDNTLRRGNSPTDVVACLREKPYILGIKVRESVDEDQPIGDEFEYRFVSEYRIRREAEFLPCLEMPLSEMEIREFWDAYRAKFAKEERSAPAVH